MAAGDPIKYSDLVDEGAFEKLIANAQNLIEIFNKAEGAIKGAMSPLAKGLSVSPKTVGDVEQINSLVKKVNELETALNKTRTEKEKLTIETAKARIEQENYNKSIKELAKDSLGLISEYQKESKLLNEMRNAYKDLALAQKQGTAEGKLLLQNITALDNKLKQVDATVGQHQRHVGNYRGAIKELSKGMSGLAGVLSSVGAAFGINTEHLEHAHSIAKELVKVTKEFSHASKISAAATELNTIATETNTVVTEGTTVAKEAETVAVQASNAAWLATPLGIFAAIALGIAAVTLAVMEFTKSEEDSAEAIHIFNEAINEQDKNITKLKLSIMETSIANDVLTGKITQQTSDRLHVQFDAIKQESDAVFKHKNAIAAINKEYAKKEAESLKEQLVARTKGLLFAGNSVEFYEEQRKKKLLVLENKFQTELSLIKTESALKNTEISNKKINELDEKAKEEKTEKEIDYWRILRDLETENIRFSYERRKQEIMNNFDDESAKYVGHTEILRQLAIKRGIALENLYIEQEKEYQKIRDNAMKQDGIKKMDAAEDPKMSPKVKANMESNIQKEKDDKKAREEEYKMAMETANTLYDIWKENKDRMAEENMADIDRKLDLNKSAIDQQFELASQGKANTLAFEMQKQDELEKARMQELERQKKVAKQQEAIELSLAFLKAYENYIGKDMKSGEALVRAFGDVSAAKLLGKALAGSALEGTEDTGSGGNLDANGGMLWKLHPHERVLTKEQNEKLGGLSNEDLVRNAMMFESIMQPNFNSSMMLNDVSKSKQVADSVNGALITEIKELQHIIKNKPENSMNIDNLGQLIKKKFENGINTISTRKNFIN